MLGQLLALQVTPANARDRREVERPAKAVQPSTGQRLDLAYIDQGYVGDGSSSMIQGSNEAHSGRSSSIGRHAAITVKLGFRLILTSIILATALQTVRATPASSPSPSLSPLRVVTFGTSLTARGGWQDALQAALQTCTGRPVVVETVARSGASSRWALTAVPRVVALKPDIILVEFSVNDAALDRLIPLSWSETNLREIVQQLRAGAPDARIALMAMNPIIGLRGAIRPFLDDYYDVNRTIALDQGLTFIDHRPGWKALSKAGLEAAIPDGSHPDASVATGIIVPNVREALFGACRPVGEHTLAPGAP